MRIGNALESTDESDEEDDEDYMDNEFGGEYGDMTDEDLDIDDDFDEDGNYIGDDPELAEAERLALAAADLPTDEEGIEEEEAENTRPSSGYTLAIDRESDFFIHVKAITSDRIFSQTSHYKPGLPCRQRRQSPRAQYWRGCRRQSHIAELRHVIDTWQTARSKILAGFSRHQQDSRRRGRG